MNGFATLYTSLLLRLCLSGAIGLLCTAAAEEVPGRLSVTSAKDKLTVVADNRPLRQVLYELGLATKVTVVVADTVVEDDNVSADLKGVSAEQAFRHLLTEYDSFFQFRGGKDGPAVLQAIWVYPKGASADLRPVPAEIWASSKDLESSLADADPAVRERAYRALLKRPDHRSRDLVLQAIRGVTEHDEALRQRILSAAVSEGMTLPATVLSELVYAEPSELLRVMALEELSRYPGVAPVAEHALKDSSEVVRQRAGEILAEANAAKHRPEHSEAGGGKQP